MKKSNYYIKYVIYTNTLGKHMYLCVGTNINP